MKLFTIGDSLSQGFMSGAAARTDQSYSTLIARAMGLNPASSGKEGSDYYYPEWKKGGLPANLENIMRRLNRRYGADIRGMEWVTILHHINRVIDESEDYYEREEGRADNKYHGDVPYFNNVSSWTFDIADSWLVTPELCREEIGKQSDGEARDGWLTCANAAFYRSALKVLSPNLDCNYTQLDWLKHHAQKRGVENLILWLGSNNALKTILTFKIAQTPNDPNNRPHRLTHGQRKKQGWNLWHPGDFKEEYNELIQRVHDIMVNHNICKDWKVFIGTVPYSTIVPIIKGIGPRLSFGRKGTYFKYYTYQPFSENFALKRKLAMPFHRAIHIDDCIREYNKYLRQIVKDKNERCAMDEGNDRGIQNNQRYYIVDLCKTFNQMDSRRNNEKPTYKFPNYFKTARPQINTHFYHVSTGGKLEKGGLFGLDGVHPTAIGQGLIAHEFIKVMKRAGVSFRDTLNWEEIFRSDTLYQQPITLMQELYKHEIIAEYLVKLIKDYI
jgi:hypothetical protein